MTEPTEQRPCTIVLHCCNRSIGWYEQELPKCCPFCGIGLTVERVERDETEKG